MRQQAKGNRVRIPDCPAAVSRSLSDDEHCATEKILEKGELFGKAFVIGRQSQKTCLVPL